MDLWFDLSANIELISVTEGPGSSPEADVERYLKHFAECSVPQLPDDVPNFLRVDVSVDIFVLLFLLIGPQLKNLAKIEERHLSGRELQGGGNGLFLVISAKKTQRFLPGSNS